MNFYKMNHPFPRALSSVAALGLSLALFSPLNAQSPGAATGTAFPSSLFSRVLVVSGGPDPGNNQYAIESNARYVAALTSGAKWRRVLFADGNAHSRTVAAVVDTPRTRARAVASWMWDLEAPRDSVTLRAPTLSPLTGAATPASIARNLAAFGQGQAGERELLYFTGHGSPGSNASGGDDFKNTLYAAWAGRFSTRELARDLQRSKSKTPLVLVMVQCHGGGFANTMFQDGDPNRPLWKRDFCGFFASTGERPAAGCTSQVNERDYQDFTTHFFAALSGISRDGRAVRSADYDGNGKVSLSEAFAYANINDDSIDVPVSTSDAFLLHVFPARDGSWRRSWSQAVRAAAPWQRAMLLGLSSRLRLSGEGRLETAQKRVEAVTRILQSDDQPSEWKLPAGVDARQFNGAYNRLKSALGARFPALETRRGASKTSALDGATTFLASQTRDLNIVYNAYNKGVATSQNEVEEALLLRFLRCARTITLEGRLKRAGIGVQIADFARLRFAENRSAF